MSNTTRHPQCHMRTSLGNCDPVGGFCTSVNESVCEALHKVSRPQGKWIITEQDNGHKWTHRKCSECGKGIIEPLGVSGMNYCPYCGADMRKGADDE